MTVRIRPDDRLQQGAGKLQDERDQADLGEIEPKVLFQNRVNGWNQRLHHVVEQMTEAEGGENLECRVHLGVG